MGETFKTDTPYKELRPLNAYDVAANECWLENLAREGYHLTGFKRYSGVFEQGEPGQWRYRMQLTANKESEPTPERMAANEQRGWTYVATWDDRFHIWKSRQMAAALDPAPNVTAEDFARLRRRLVLTNGVLLLMTLALLVFTAWTRLDSPAPLWTEIYGSMAGGSILLLLLELSALVLIIHELTVGLQMLRKLEEREPLERPKSYRGQKWFARVSFVLSIVFVVTGLLGNTLEEPWSAREKGSDEPKAGAVYVDLRVLDGTPAEETFFFGPETKVHELAPRMWFIKQYAYANTPADEQIMAHTEYYRLLTKHLAPQLEKDLLYWNSDTDMEEIICVTLDRFRWGERVTRDGLREQIVVVSSGRNVMFVAYRGPTDLRTQEAYFTELLSR